MKVIEFELLDVSHSAVLLDLSLKQQQIITVANSPSASSPVTALTLAPVIMQSDPDAVVSAAG